MADTVRKEKWPQGPQECVHAYFGTLGTIWDEMHSRGEAAPAMPMMLSGCGETDGD